MFFEEALPTGLGDTGGDRIQRLYGFGLVSSAYELGSLQSFRLQNTSLPT